MGRINDMQKWFKLYLENTKLSCMVFTYANDKTSTDNSDF